MRTKTPSFILELPLKVSKSKEKELLSRFQSARQLYNAVLGEAKKRVLLVKQSKLFQEAKKIPKNDKNKTLRKEEFQKARNVYDLNEYSLHKYIVELRHKLCNNLDVHTTQKLATRAFKAVEKMLYGNAKKVRFKGINSLHSVESKSNDAGIRWRDNKVIWNGLSLPSIIDGNDEVIQHGLSKKVKYCRIFRKIIKGKNRFYVQLVLEGKPFIKEKNKLGEGSVCYDEGPSTIAIVSKNNNDEFSAKLQQFCPELDLHQKEITNLQRKIDRQRRSNNPDNFADGNGLGKIKKGHLKWKKSRHQRKTEAELLEKHRKISAYRKSLHGKLINETLRMGNDFYTEKVSKKWFQKLYGKSVGIRAPGMYASELKRKAESAGASYTEFSTLTTKLSQTCVCGRQKKKKLSDRVHNCECRVYSQRDLFSAFLGLFVEKVGEKYILQTDQAARLWSSADKLLRTVWSNSLQSMSRGTCPSSFGTISQSQNRSFVEKGIVKSKVQDVVIGAVSANESLKADKIFSLEPAGFQPQRSVSREIKET